MNVRFSFAMFFSNIIGTERAEINIPEGTTVEEALNIFLRDNPEYYRSLHEKKLFLLGDFRAIYHINRLIVKKDHVLQPGDELNILKAFIGG